MKVAVVDLGCGNTGSVAFALERLGAEPLLTNDTSEIESADRVILPGVGTATHAMERVDELGLGHVLKTVRQPALGICLGMQLLFERSDEGRTPCLGLIPGKVRKLHSAPALPVPHMGWSKVEPLPSVIGVETGYYYFAHSFACEDGPSTIATCTHGAPIPAVVQHNNWMGVQFHPERSGAIGARFLKSFLS